MMNREDTGGFRTGSRRGSCFSHPLCGGSVDRPIGVVCCTAVRYVAISLNLCVRYFCPGMRAEHGRNIDVKFFGQHEGDH